MKKVTLGCILIALCFCLCSCKSSDYKKAVALYDEGAYQQAKEMFMELEDYKDSAEFVKKSSYQEAIGQYEAGQYQQAKEGFANLGDYEDAADYVKKCDYQEAVGQYEAGQYEQAKEIFTSLGDYEDAAEYVKKCSFAHGIAMLEGGGPIAKARKIFEELGDFDGAPYYVGLCCMKTANYSDAKASFEKVTEDSEYYSQAVKKIEQCDNELLYEQAMKLCQNKPCSNEDFNKLREIVPQLKGFSKASGLVKLVKELEEEGFAGSYKTSGATLEVLVSINTNSFKREYTVVVADKKKIRTYYPCHVEDGKIYLLDETDPEHDDILYRNCKETILIEEPEREEPDFFGIISPIKIWETELYYLEKTEGGIKEYERKSYGYEDNFVMKSWGDLMADKKEPKRVIERKFTPVENSNQ